MILVIQSTLYLAPKNNGDNNYFPDNPLHFPQLLRANICFLLFPPKNARKYIINQFSRIKTEFILIISFKN
ncbi:hypothetical protein EB821_03830 [Candidatus Marinimicrobia bacterium PRS2]|nr:hypothetical protein EB821_03830 [Candidatus Marinimicrobia bacterium PRS2]